MTVPGTTKVALVTGGGSGLGRSIAIALGGGGWSVALAGRTAAPLEETARAVLAAPAPDVAVYPGDVTREEEVASLMDGVGDRFGRLDLLVHAAGYGRFTPLPDTSLEDWQRTLATNLTAVFLVTRAALPLLSGAPRPVIVALSSVAGRQAFRDCAAYCASKHGLEGLLAVMRAELRGRGIRVLSVAAGATATPFWDPQPGEWDRARMMAPEDVARLVVQAIEAPAGVAVEEILVRPAGGDL